MADPVDTADPSLSSTTTGDPSWPPLWAAPGHVAAYADLHPDDKEWARGVDHSGLTDAFEQLHPEDKLAALHPNAHSAEDVAIDAGVNAGGQPAAPMGGPTAADEASPGYIDFSKPPPDAMPQEDVLPAEPTAPAADAASVTDEYAKPSASQYRDDAILHENERPSSKYSDDEMLHLALGNPVQQAKFRQIQADDAMFDQKRIADAQIANHAESQRIANEQIEVQKKAAAEADAKMAAWNAEADRVAKFGRQDYLTGRSTAKKLGDFISLIAGGVAAGQVPGGNGVNHAAVDFENEINNSIKNQMETLGQKRSALSESIMRTGNLNQSIYAVKQAALQQQYSDITTEAQKYDSRGSRGLALAGVAQQSLAMSAAAAEQQRQEHFKEEVAAQTAGLAVRKQAVEEKTKQVELNQAGQRIGQEGWKIGADIKAKQADQKLAQDRLDWEKTKPTPAAEALANKQAEEERNQQLGGRVVGVDDKGNPQYAPFLQKPDPKTGKREVWRIPEKDIEAIHKIVPAADEMNSLVDQLVRDIKEYGVSSAVGQGALKQRITSNAKLLDVAVHDNLGIASFRPGTLEAIHDVGGGVDPKSLIHDAGAGLLNMKRVLNEEVNHKLRRAGYDGQEDFAPPDTSKAVAPSLSPADEAFKSTFLDPMPTDVKDITKAMQARGGTYSPGVSNAFEQRALDQRDAMKQIKQDLVGTPEQHAAAIEMLKQIAKSPNAIDGNDDEANRVLQAIGAIRVGKYGPSGENTTDILENATIPDSERGPQ